MVPRVGDDGEFPEGCARGLLTHRARERASGDVSCEAELVRFETNLVTLDFQVLEGPAPDSRDGSQLPTINAVLARDVERKRLHCAAVVDFAHPTPGCKIKLLHRPHSCAASQRGCHCRDRSLRHRDLLCITAVLRGPCPSEAKHSRCNSCSTTISAEPDRVRSARLARILLCEVSR